MLLFVVLLVRIGEPLIEEAAVIVWGPKETVGDTFLQGVFVCCSESIPGECFLDAILFPDAPVTSKLEDAAAILFCCRCCSNSSSSISPILLSPTPSSVSLAEQQELEQQSQAQRGNRPPLWLLLEAVVAAFLDNAWFDTA